jgi:hypothetical protein
MVSPFETYCFCYEITLQLVFSGHWYGDLHPKLSLFATSIRSNNLFEIHGLYGGPNVYLRQTICERKLAPKLI